MGHVMCAVGLSSLNRAEMYPLKHEIWSFWTYAGPSEVWRGPLNPGTGSLRPGMVPRHLKGPQDKDVLADL